MNKSAQLKERIFQYITYQPWVTTGKIAEEFQITRQHALRYIKTLTQEQKVTAEGKGRSRIYKAIGTKGYETTVANKDLEEHLIVQQIESSLPELQLMKDHVHSTYYYGLSEMLNNAIDHSKSPTITVRVWKTETHIHFVVEDNGVGVFRNIMTKFQLHSYMEAIQELLKGKTTTQPEMHSGEGIFFTSKVADLFELESRGTKLRVDNTLPDIFIETVEDSIEGTRVTFTLSLATKKHLNDVFVKYQTDPKEFAFDRTEIHIVKLYTMGTIYISRSQAKRIASGLEKFNEVILDFEKVPTVGQAFADELFRVFHNRYPHVQLNPINMSPPVQFMIERARTST